MATDSKYDISTGSFINRQSGHSIPDDEPVFIFRARDLHTVSALSLYAALCRNKAHRHQVEDQIQRFLEFQREHPDRMKEPGPVPEPAEENDNG